MALPCPCCGGPLLGAALNWLPDAGVLVWDRNAAKLSRNETAFFNALWDARRTSRILSTSDLAGVIWARDPNGGPDSFIKGIGVLAYDTRQKIKGSGLTIVGERGSQGGYRIAADKGRSHGAE